MLKKAASFVLASLRGSTYHKEYASPLRSLRPRWTAFLNILQGPLTLSGISQICLFWRSKIVFPQPPDTSLRLSDIWGRLLAFVVLGAFLLAWVSCAGSPTRSGERHTKNPVGYVQRGVASWYGPGFHGNQTANGERYNMHAHTAAHRTLPMGSVVEVRSLTTDRRVRVRINDRGPFVKGRIIDLSYKAAKDLGMAIKGTDRVEIRVIDYRHRPGDRGVLRVQVGSFADKGNALALKAEIERKYPDVLIVPVNLGGETHYRVLVGQFVSERHADALAEELEARLAVETIVIRDDT